MTNGTHDTDTTKKDRAILVSLVTDEVKRSGINHEYSLQELVKLAETAGVEVLSINPEPGNKGYEMVYW